jgi:hypothetical protein
MPPTICSIKQSNTHGIWIHGSYIGDLDHRMRTIGQDDGQGGERHKNEQHNVEPFNGLFCPTKHRAKSIRFKFHQSRVHQTVAPESCCPQLDSENSRAGSTLIAYIVANVKRRTPSVARLRSAEPDCGSRVVLSTARQ